MATIKKDITEEKTPRKRVLSKTKETPTLEKVVQENVRHIEENTREIHTNSSMIHILYGIIIVLMLIIAGLAFFVGTKLGSGGSNVPGITQAQDIEITVIDDIRCTDCQTTELLTQLKTLPFLTGATFVQKDFAEKGVAEYLKANSITLLPAIIFNTNTLNDAGQITPYLKATTDGKGFSLALPAKFNPFAKRSANGFLLLEGDTLKNIQAESTIQGNKDAKISWIEYSDVQCPYCAKLHNEGTPKTVSEKYGENLNIIFQHFPLDFHDQAQKGAEVLECIAEQKADVLYTVIEALYKKYPKQDATVEGIKDIAAENGVNKETLTSCIDSGKFTEKVKNQMKVGQEVFGITGTPGNIIINTETGEYEVISGAYPASAFEAIIDKMLK